MLGRFSSRIITSTRNWGALQKRSKSVIYGPPTVHFSKAEEYILGSILCGSMLAIPTWVLLHIAEYKAPK